MKELPLLNGTIIKLDDEDFERIKSFYWSNTGTSIHRTITIKRNRYKYKSLSNEIFNTEFLMYDHINRDYLDFQKSNLRITDYSSNGANRSKSKNKSSKYKGVSFYKRDNNWKASIRFWGKLIHLGYFNLEEDAARAYDNAAKKYFGEFACLNF